MSIATAFDSIAARYDEVWTNSAVGRAQRDAVWRATNELFRRGDRILDIGCGTGEDAAHFTMRGVAVHAIDASPAMIEIASERGGFSTAVLGVEELAELRGTFDGAISNFGALNCVEDLPSVVRHLAARVRARGPVAICTIGRFCAWETLYFACRLDFVRVLRRLRGTASFSPAATAIQIHYPSVAELSAAFAPHFELQRWSGIGLLVPPSYVHLPSAVVRVLGAIDRVAARLQVLRALADHRLLIFVRK